MNGYSSHARQYDDYDPYGSRGGGGGGRGPPRDDPYYSRRPPDADPYRSHDRRQEQPPYGARLPDGPRGEDPYARYNKEDIYSRPQRAANGGHYDHGGGGGGSGGGGGLGACDLDHLATFTVSPKQGLMSPSDGIQKLRQMEMTTGIWTMRVKLTLDARDLVIIDRQTGEEMERFPFSLLADVTAITNRDRRDVYNNIVLFTVQEDPYKGSPSEMHLFQVIDKPAQDVVDDIKGVQMEARGAERSNYGSRPPREVSAQVQQYERAAAHAARAAEAYTPGPRPRDAFQRSMRRQDDQDTVVSERTDRDVQLLNHCFDDIEKFVGRLQHAAEAFKELDLRRRNRQDRKKTGYGDGMLSMRARPPPAKDFIDIFQKFKLSFNLLAKLKAHIHDPNAPELVHFLFTPLSLVVEASKDPRHGTPDLAAKVVSPLLTAEAKDLLLNCLTSKEADLWMSLGDAWKFSRDEWKGYAPPFVPRFSDGWQPAGWSDESTLHDPRQAPLHDPRQVPAPARNVSARNTELWTFADAS